MNNLTEQEAFNVADFINSYLFTAIKQDGMDDMEWLSIMVSAYRKLSSYSDYNNPYANETKEDESDDPGVDPWTIVYFTLFDNYRMLRGCYDARSDDEHYMYGVEAVMGIIAEKAGKAESFKSVFENNMKESLIKAGKF